MNYKLIQKVAAKAGHRQHLHVVIITKGGAILSTGYNHGDTHAEVMALTKLWPAARKGTRLYSYRLLNNGKLAMAKPCLHCQKVIERAGVKQVFWSDPDGKIVKTKVGAGDSACYHNHKDP